MTGVLMEIMQNNSGNHFSSTSYRGSAAFTAGDAEFLPGREEPTGELTGNRPSGSGGSSPRGREAGATRRAGAAGGGRSPWRPRRW
jgi:hypothetical protein